MASLPLKFMDCVVAVGTDDVGGNQKWIASGFLYGRRQNDDEDGILRVFLVSNRHVFEPLSKAYLRFNPVGDDTAQTYEILLNFEGRRLWTAHPRPDVDIAATGIDVQLLRDDGMHFEFFHEDEHSADIGKMRELGAAEGDSIYVLGFPMGLVGLHRNVVIVRGGSIARIRDTLTAGNCEFLVDSLVFPGNSGGPVIWRPFQESQGAYLIGIVRAYVPYQDHTVSLKTGKINVFFEDNSGLAAVHPVDFIEETIDLCIKDIECRE